MNSMLTLSMPAILLLLFSASSAYALDWGETLDSAVKTTEKTETVANESSSLISSLSSQLAVTKAQATGGAAALTSLASNTLSSDKSTLLNSLIPSGDAGGLSSQALGNITDMTGVKSAFQTLGMDGAMVEQFAPIIIDYLAKNGGISLVGSLTQLWM